MMIDRLARKVLFETVARRVIDSADELTDLDRAIGDGDHGTKCAAALRPFWHQSTSSPPGILESP
jgi:hypothetical protein